VHPVKKAMYGRGQDYADICNENHPAEQGIKRGEKFADPGIDIHHRSHPAQDHTGIVQGIQPSYTGSIMITQYTNHQTYKHYKYSKQETFYDSSFKNTE
jgi:hypothetical protein